MKKDFYLQKAVNIRLISSMLIFSVLFVFPFSVTAEDTPPETVKTKLLLRITRDFSQPSDVSVSRDGRVYVLDGVNGKVKVFNRNGKFIFSFGKTGAEKGEFSLPLGIFVDDTGMVYVADSGNHRVQVFTAEGKYVDQFSTEREGDTAVHSDPTDVVVNNKLKRCFVVDNDK